jgi:hypothetical protein
MYGAPHGRVYKAQGELHHFKSHLPISLALLHLGDIACNPPHIGPPQEVGYYAFPSGPNLLKIACSSLVHPARTIELKSIATFYQKYRTGNPGCAVGL